jgi:hypothetical protein
MSTTYLPFGLKPAYHPSGLDRATQFVGTNSFQAATDNTYNAPYGLTTGQSFYQYQPVAINSSGQLIPAPTLAATGRMFGVFDGVEFTDSQGRRSVAKWASKLTLDASTQIIFWIFSDPALVYEIQCNGSVATSAIGREYDFDATNTPLTGSSIGNGGAGFSTTALASAPVSAGAQGQVKVVGLGREVAFPTGETNAWADAKTIVQVQVANSQIVAPAISV